MAQENQKSSDTAKILDPSYLFIEKIHEKLEKKIEEQQAEIERLQKIINDSNRKKEKDKIGICWSSEDEYSSTSEELANQRQAERCEEVEIVKKRAEIGHIDQLMNYLAVINIEKPKEKPLFYLTYNSSTNKYKSSLAEFDDKLDWLSLTHKTSNLSYYTQNYDYDPNCNYVSRNEQVHHKQVGLVHWRFNLEKLNNWSRVELILNGKVWIGTEIDLSIRAYKTADDNSDFLEERLLLNSLNILKREKLMDPKMIDLCVELKGLNVDVATKRPKNYYHYPQILTNPAKSSEANIDTFIFNVY